MWNGYDGNGVPLQSVPLGYTIISAFAITSGTTYTVAAGTRAILVECMGGGGGGGGANTSGKSSRRTRSASGHFVAAARTWGAVMVSGFNLS